MPKYGLFTIPHRVKFECTFEFTGNFFSFISGVTIVVKKPLEIPNYQTDFIITCSPEATEIPGEIGHTLLVWHLKGRKTSCTVIYEYIYHQRCIEFFNPAKHYIKDNPPSESYHKLYTTEIHGIEPNRYNYKSELFNSWFTEGNLHESPENENEYDFAVRVLEHMANTISISMKFSSIFLIFF